VLDYAGFDLTSLNIDNARQMFPGVDFRLGDVQDVDAADQSYDWAVAHDLLEHLSPAACNRPIDELCRIAWRGVLSRSSSWGSIPSTGSRPSGPTTSTISAGTVSTSSTTLHRHPLDPRPLVPRERTAFSDSDNNNA
jgi:Methyltransferase domain